MEILELILKGLAAGLVGTTALTISETLEMKVTKRPASDIPGQVGAKVPGVEPQNDKDLTRLSGKVHWIHGISLGVLYAVLSLLGLDTSITIIIFFALVWGGNSLLYKALGIAPFPWKSKASEIMPDLFNKGIYAIVVGLMFAILA